MSDDQHYLHIIGLEESGETIWEVSHPKSCGTHVVFPGDDYHEDFVEYNCAVGFEMGLIGPEFMEPFPDENGYYYLDVSHHQGYHGEWDLDLRMDKVSDPVELFKARISFPIDGTTPSSYDISCLHCRHMVTVDPAVSMPPVWVLCPDCLAEKSSSWQPPLDTPSSAP